MQNRSFTDGQKAMDNRQSIPKGIQIGFRVNLDLIHLSCIQNSKQSIAWSAEEWFALVSAKSCTVAIWARPRRLNKPFTVALVGVDPKIFKDQDWGDSSSSFLRFGCWSPEEVHSSKDRGEANIEGSILNCHNSSRSDYFHFLHRSQ